MRSILLPLTIFTSPVITHAATVTFFTLNATPTQSSPTGSVTYRPIGVGADGATTYAEEFVWSEEVRWSQSKYTTGGSVQTADVPMTTVSIPAQTLSGTVVADATHYFYNYTFHPNQREVELNVLQNCDFDGKGGMSCVGTVFMSGQPIATTSITGTAMPAYTLVTVDGQANTKNGSAGKHVSGLLVVVISIGSLLGFTTLVWM